MTNSSPQPPETSENETRRSPAVSFEEMVAIIVAFSTIGIILFWSLGSGIRKEILSIAGSKDSFASWKKTLLSPLETTRSPDSRVATAAKDRTVASDGVFFREATIEPLERDSRYLERQTGIRDIDGIDAFGRLYSPARPDNILTSAAPVATGLALSRGKVVIPTETDIDTSAVTETESATKTPAAVESETTTTPTPVESETTTETSPLAFEDVTSEYWAYPFINTLGEKQLISGFTGNNLFEPDKLITRASMATLIGQAFDRPTSQQAKNFTDVSNQNALAADIRKAVETGFMKGYSDNKFRPLQNIPRYQVLVALATGLGLNPSQNADDILSKFDDTDKIPDWAREQVAAAAEAGLAVNRPGFSKNSLNPEQEATRAEVAAMIHQALVRADKLESINSQYIVKP